MPALRPAHRLLPAAMLLMASMCRVYDPSLLEGDATGSGGTGNSTGFSTSATSSGGGATTTAAGGSGGMESTTDATTTGSTGGSGGDGTTSGGMTGGSGGGGSTGGSGGDSNSNQASTTGGSCEEDDCCLDNPDKTDPGQCGCDQPDTDTDSDGTADCIDECPDHAGKTEPGECGCEVPDEDTAQVAGCVGLKEGLLHRYSFDGSGSDAVDSQGDADAVLTGTTLNGGGALVLSTASVQYATLPAGILSELSSASIEAWFTWTGGALWTRLFDFGSTVEAMPGEPGTGLTSVLFTPNGAQDPGFPYAGFSTDTDPVVSCNGNSALSTGVEHHVVLSLDTSLQTLTLYVDGALACATAMPRQLSQLDDVNCWIGRSQFASDVGFSGRIEEFRIYDVALDARQVALSFASGPEPDFL